MATVIRSIGITGITGYPIAVQVKVLAGLSIINIVGLGDQAVKEAKDRIESAFDQLWTGIFKLYVKNFTYMY